MGGPSSAPGICYHPNGHLPVLLVGRRFRRARIALTVPVLAPPWPATPDVRALVNGWLTRSATSASGMPASVASCCSITFTASVEAGAVIASEIARMRMSFGTAAPPRHRPSRT